MRTKKTKNVFLAMNILSGLIFIGLCVKTGAILFSFFVSLFVNADAAKDLYLNLDLSSLLEFNRYYYMLMVALIAALPALKAYLFFLIIKVLSRINLVHPFSSSIGSLIKKMSIVSLCIGILASSGVWLSVWLVNSGVHMITAPQYLSGGSEFLFFAGIIFMIFLVFRKGIEMQTENELTI